MAQLHPTSLYITLPWLCFTLLYSTLSLLDSTSLYTTLPWLAVLDSTLLYHCSTQLYLTLHNSTMAVLYLTLYYSTMTLLHSILYSFLFYHGSMSFYFSLYYFNMAPLHST